MRMKRLIYILFFCFLSSCIKPEVPVLLLTSGKQLQFDVEGGSGVISFTTNQIWSAVSSSDWCSLSQIRGEQGDVAVNITCQPNPEYRERECSVTIIAAGLYLLVSISQSPNIKVEPVPISSKIYGEWVVKKGDVTGFLLEGDLYSQTIEFKENGNFKESVFYRLDYYSNSLSVLCDNVTKLGNWHGADDVICLNDWDNSLIVEGIKVVSVSDDELTLEFQGRPLTYVRASAEFSNLETDILGSWFSITDSNYKGCLRLEKDGTGCLYQYIHSNSLGYYRTNNYNFSRWWIQDNALHAECQGSVLPFKVYIDFINEKYIGIRGYEVMRRD